MIIILLELIDFKTYGRKLLVLCPSGTYKKNLVIRLDYISSESLLFPPLH